MAAPGEYIHGYHASIHRGLWERILTAFAPRMWTVAWGGLNVYLALTFGMLWGVAGLVIPMILWPLGQLTLVLLTRWDRQWDEIFVAKVSRGYPTYLRAG